MKQIVYAILIVTAIGYADYFDSGMIIWKQPNGVEFSARLKIDEYSFHMETNNDFTLKKGKDGYFYYAVLNKEGEYAASDKKVGIDQPLQVSYKLTRSHTRLLQIEERKDRE